MHPDLTRRLRRPSPRPTSLSLPARNPSPGGSQADAAAAVRAVIASIRSALPSGRPPSEVIDGVITRVMRGEKPEDALKEEGVGEVPDEVLIMLRDASQLGQLPVGSSFLSSGLPDLLIKKFLGS